MSSGFEINNAAVLAEIAEVSDRYENALVENDVAVLNGLFWESPLALRFGATEELYGADAIAGFRQRRKIDFTERKTLRRELLAVGRDLAVATLEFSVVVRGVPRHGRQTQVWARLNGAGWRIVSAHVSHRLPASAGAAAEFGAAAAALLALQVDPAYASGVRANLESTAKIAEPLLAFGLPPDVEPAPVFRP